MESIRNKTGFTHRRKDIGFTRLIGAFVDLIFRSITEKARENKLYGQIDGANVALHSLVSDKLSSRKSVS